MKRIRKISSIGFILFLAGILAFTAGCMDGNQQTTTTSSTTITTSSTTTTTLAEGECNTKADCSSFCRTNVDCQGYDLYHIESSCVDGECKCECVSDELPVGDVPENNTIEYKNETYTKTDKITSCRGSLQNLEEYSLWTNTINGHVYSAYEMNYSSEEYKCHLWIQEPGLLVDAEGEYKQGNPVDLELRNIDIKEHVIVTPISFQKKVNGSWKHVKQTCACDAICSKPMDITLEEGQSREYKWDGLTEYCQDGELVEEIVSPGEYRMKARMKNNKTAYSDVFKIEPNVEVSLETNGDLYHSEDIMKIKVNVTSAADLGPAVLNVQGVTASAGKGLSVEKNITLDAGTKNYSITYLVPSCGQSECSPIQPGDYGVKAGVIWNKDMVDGDGKKVRIEP